MLHNQNQGVGKMSQRAKLTKIPKKIQETYNIGPTVIAEVNTEVMGGEFTFNNKKGEEVKVDAVELSGTGIMVQDL